MTERAVQDDIDQVDRWLATPDAGFSELKDDFDHIRSPDQMRRFLEGLREGLIAARDGDVFSHDEIRRDVDERRRRYSPHAAE